MQRLEEVIRSDQVRERGKLKMIFAIDPGNIESAFVIVTDDLSKVINKGKVYNEDLLDIICFVNKVTHVAIEGIQSYGMPVGKEVFETCYFIGRLQETFLREHGKFPLMIYRMEEKMCLCHSTKAKDSNIRQALIDRFGEVGTKKNPGFFYGFKKDIWSAMAVATTYHDKYLKGEEI